MRTQEFDLITDQLDQTFDLVVCSEVLYYAAPRELRSIIDRLTDAVRPGGHLVHAHAYEASERRGQPGFGWRQPFGATTISRLLGESPKLRLQSTIETDLYVVERYGRCDTASPPSYDWRPVDRRTLEPEIDHQVLWSGYRTSPQDAAGLETRSLAVLAYHLIGDAVPSGLARYNIAPDSFAAQLEWLRVNGYRSAEPEEVLALARCGRPLRGKAVCLTFDDAYRSFATTAWPLLQAYGFGATLFVPTAHIGGEATWDARFGRPEELLSEAELQQLAGQGVRIGSHFHQHRALTQLTTSQLVEGFTESRRQLTEICGQDVRLIAYPFGQSDPVIERLAGYCGYRLGFTTSGEALQPFDHPLSVSRVLVDGTVDPVGQLIGMLSASDHVRLAPARATARRTLSALRQRIQARTP